MKKIMIAVGGLMAMALLTAAACEKVPMGTEDAAKSAQTAREAPVAPTPESQPAAPTSPGTLGTIVITGSSGPVTFSVEIATTDEERARGLQGRESIPENFGMWFVFPQTGSERFWMKDTKIPLDMIFVDENMKVVHVIENAVPESTELLSSPTPYRYVLEVNGGTAAKHGIKVGSTVEKRIGLQ